MNRRSGVKRGTRPCMRWVEGGGWNGGRPGRVWTAEDRWYRWAFAGITAITVTACRHDFTLQSRPARLTAGKAAYLRVSWELATTPKLTGGHDVARGPERIDGFALRPARTSQLESLKERVPMRMRSRGHGRRPSRWRLGGIMIDEVVLW